ncbi:hypothetical protein FA13DRAFT_1733082, partial [Coprinellus micaceus]
MVTGISYRADTVPRPSNPNEIFSVAPVPPTPSSPPYSATPVSKYTYHIPPPPGRISASQTSRHISFIPGPTMHMPACRP